MTLVGNLPSNAVITPVTTNPANPAFVLNTPAYQNFWADWGAPYQGARYSKDGRGFVQLDGLIKDGSVNNTAFTLPPGFRPNAPELFPSFKVEAIAPSWIIVSANGGVLIGGDLSGGSPSIPLSGVSFQAFAAAGPTTVGSLPSNVEITDVESRVLVEPWQALPLNTGDWEPMPGYQPPEFTRDVFGNVHLRGTVRLWNSPPGNPIVVAALPSGYRMNNPTAATNGEVVIGPTVFWPTGTSFVSGGGAFTTFTEPNSFAQAGWVILRTAENLSSGHTGMVLSLSGISFQRRPTAPEIIPVNFGDVPLNGRFPVYSVTEDAWTNLTISGSTSAALYPQPLAYAKDRFNNVHLRGAVDITVSGTITIATLPVGFRPAFTVYRTYYDPAHGAVYAYIVNASGQIIWNGNGSPASGPRIDFSGHTWRAA